jgi:hypothetical protein
METGEHKSCALEKQSEKILTVLLAALIRLEANSFLHYSVQLLSHSGKPFFRGNTQLTLTENTAETRRENSNHAQGK